MSAPTGIEAAVCADIASRQAVGIAKYGTTVADNPLSLLEWLTHAYQECLDQAIYLRRAIAELELSEKQGNISDNNFAKTFMSTATPNPDCACSVCNPKAWWMVVCSKCGNKRCPHAADHKYECTNSNEPDQVPTLAKL